MNVKVRYYSKTGNTKKLAEAIAEAAGVKGETVAEPVNDETDVLFLGAAVYAYGVSKEIKDFIGKLNPSLVKKVVVFSDSALAERAYPSVARLLKDKGINVAEENFYCRGQFLHLHTGRPNAEDLASAKSFAKKIVG